MYVCVCVVTQAFHLKCGSGPSIKTHCPTHPPNYRRELSYGSGSPPTTRPPPHHPSLTPESTTVRRIWQINIRAVPLPCYCRCKKKRRRKERKKMKRQKSIERGACCVDLQLPSNLGYWKGGGRRIRTQRTQMCTGLGRTVSISFVDTGGCHRVFHWTGDPVREALGLGEKAQMGKATNIVEGTMALASAKASIFRKKFTLPKFSKNSMRLKLACKLSRNDKSPSFSSVWTEANDTPMIRPSRYPMSTDNVRNIFNISDIFKGTWAKLYLTGTN